MLHSSLPLEISRILTHKKETMANQSTDWITISDEFQGYSLDLFNIPKHYKNTLESVLIPAGLIEDRTDKLALDIYQHYLKVLPPGESILALCTLKGAYRLVILLILYDVSVLSYQGSYISYSALPSVG